jgi:hypothetical protein
MMNLGEEERNEAHAVLSSTEWLHGIWSLGIMMELNWMVLWNKIFASNYGYLAGQETNCFFKLHNSATGLTEACHGTVLWTTSIELTTSRALAMNLPLSTEVSDGFLFCFYVLRYNCTHVFSENVVFIPFGKIITVYFENCTKHTKP